MGSSKKQKRDKEREERKAEEGDFPKLKAMADGSKKQKKPKTTQIPEEVPLQHTIVPRVAPSPEALPTPNQGGGVLTKEVIGQSGLSVVSLVNSSSLSSKVQDSILEEQEEETIILDYDYDEDVEEILMDKDEFENWNESFTHRECDVMAMGYAEYQAEKASKEAVAGAGLVAPTIPTTVLTPHPTSVSHPTSVLPTYHAPSIIRGTTVGTPKVIPDEREAALRKMKSHTDKSVDIMRKLKMRETDVLEMSRKIDEDAKILTSLQEEKEKEKVEREELKARIKLLEGRESKHYDLINTYALKLSHGKGADPNPNAYKKPLNQTVAGRPMMEISGNKTHNLPAYMTKSAGLSLPSMHQGGGAASGNKTQATPTHMKNDGSTPGHSTTMTGFTGTLSGNKTQVIATPAINNGGIPGHSTTMTGSTDTTSGNKTQVNGHMIGATTNLGAQAICVTDEILLIDKISEIKILIQESEKLFIQTKDSSILSYVVEKKKELGEAQQNLNLIKSKNTNLIASLVKGSGSPYVGTPQPLTMNDFLSGVTPPDASRASLYTSHALRDGLNHSRTIGGKVVGTTKFSQIYPPEGFLGINNSDHPGMINTMSATAYLGRDTGLNKYYNSVKAQFATAEIPSDVQQLMIHMTVESWEKQRQNLIKLYGHDSVPERLEIQFIDTFLGVTGKQRFAQMSNFIDLMDTLKKEYINEDTIRKILTDIRTSSQGDRDIYAYAHEFCKLVDELEAIAPERTTNKEILSDFLNGLTDENIRRAIMGKIDVDTDTLAKAIEVIKTDIRESKRKLTRAQETRDRGQTPKHDTSSSIPSGHDDGYKKRHSHVISSSGVLSTVAPKPAWHNTETKKVFAYRMFKGTCIRCGSPQHKATARPGTNDPVCPLKHDDYSKRTLQPDDQVMPNGYSDTIDYFISNEAKKMKRDVQGVADHSRLQAQKKGLPGPK